MRSIVKTTDTECKLCNKKHKTTTGLANHIIHHHVKKNDINSLKEYYDRFINQDDGICPTCGKRTEFLNLKYGYKKHCNCECANKDPHSRKLKSENTKKALLKKYGVSNPGMLPDHQEKVKNTNLKNHGVEHYVNVEKNLETNLKNHNGIHSSSTKEYKEKYIKTCLEKYGVDHHTRSKEYIEHLEQNNLKKYGYKYTHQIPEVKEKIKNIFNERYGGMLRGSPVLSEKIKKTNLEKYGFENPIQNPEIRKKCEQTNIERYGSACTLSNKAINQKLFGVDHINQINGMIEKQQIGREKTLLERYQVTNSYQIKEVLEKTKQIFLERYGTENPLQAKEIKEKIKQGYLEKYGVEYNMQVPEIREKVFTSNGRKKYRLQQFILPNNNIIKYQSNLELLFINRCIEKNIEIENGPRIKYIFDNKQHCYFVDFIIKNNNQFQLIEIKGKTKWYFESLETGILFNKIAAAQLYSMQNNYLPFLILYNKEDVEKW